MSKKKEKEEKKEFDWFAKKTIFAVILVAVSIVAIAFAGAYFSGRIVYVNPTETTTTTTLTTTTTEVKNFDISIKVVNEYTNEPIEGAVIYLDGSDVGVTNQDGTKIIKNVLKGSHNIEAIYKSISSKTAIEVFSASNFNVKIKAHISVKLTIRDLESSNAVKNVRVYLDGSYKDTTLSTGEVVIKDVLPGTYTLSLDEVTGRPSARITIGTESSLNIEMDMPNPDLKLSSGRFETSLWFTGERGQCKDVKAINTGDVQSEFTVAVCLVYQIKDNKTYFLGADSHSFGSVAARGESPSWNSKIFEETKTLYEEDAVIVFYDTNDYIPTTDWSLRLNIPNSFIEQWTLEA